MASSSGYQGQNRVQPPRRTPSHGAQIPPSYLPHIHISLDTGEPFDLGLKHEISQQVRELRAQKHQRARNPVPIQDHNQAAGQGASKGPSKSQKEHSSQGPAGQSDKLPNPYPLGPSNQKEKPRDRPLSAPSQAAIQGLLSADPQLKALQPHPQSPRQVQTPQSGSNPVSIPGVKLVSHRPCGRSHSPCCRIDVDVEPEHQGGWQNGMRAAVSHESFMVPSDGEVTAFDPTDFHSQFFPDGALHSALPRHSYSPVSNDGSCLRVPDNNHLHLPASDWGIKRHNAIGDGSSLSALSDSAAPENILGERLAEFRLMRFISSHCPLSSSPSVPPAWLGLSPRTSPQLSPTQSLSSPSSLWSLSLVSPPLSPHDCLTTLVNKSFPSIHNHLIPPVCKPHCSSLLDL